MWKNDRWPLGGVRAVLTDRDDVKREPLTPPKVERATEMGMIHDMTPNNFSPNVWETKKKKDEDKLCHIRNSSDL